MAPWGAMVSLRLTRGVDGNESVAFPRPAPAGPIAGSDTLAAMEGGPGAAGNPQPQSWLERRRQARAERKREREEAKRQKRAEREARKRHKRERRGKAEPATAPPPAPPAGTPPAAPAEDGRDEHERQLRAAAERQALARLEETQRELGEEHAVAEAERRIRELEQRQREAEQRLEEARAKAEERAERATAAAVAAEQLLRVDDAFADPGPGDAAAEPDPGDALADARETERRFEQRRERDDELASELEAAERRLAENQRRSAEALKRAAERLDEIEARAAKAEERAERAQRLADLRSEEAERTQRLREMLDRIAAAERRAGEAQQRARRALDQARQPPEIDPDQILPREVEPAEDPNPGEPPAEVGSQAWEGHHGAPDAPPLGPEPPSPPPEPVAQELRSPRWAQGEEGGWINLNEVTYEELRSLGLSVTQAGRVLAHRERSGGFASTDELDRIPGFSAALLAELKRLVRV